GVAGVAEDVERLGDRGGDGVGFRGGGGLAPEAGLTPPVVEVADILARLWPVNSVGPDGLGDLPPQGGGLPRGPAGQGAVRPRGQGPARRRRPGPRSAPEWRRGGSTRRGCNT